MSANMRSEEVKVQLKRIIMRLPKHKIKLVGHKQTAGYALKNRWTQESNKTVD